MAPLFSEGVKTLLSPPVLLWFYSHLAGVSMFSLLSCIQFEGLWATFQFSKKSRKLVFNQIKSFYFVIPLYIPSSLKLEFLMLLPVLPALGAEINQYWGTWGSITEVTSIASGRSTLISSLLVTKHVFPARNPFYRVKVDRIEPRPYPLPPQKTELSN